MNKKQVKYILLFLMSIMSYSHLKSQAPEGSLREISIMDNLDTLLTNRKYGDFWFGMNFGMGYNKYLGTVYLPTRFPLPSDTIYKYNTDSISLFNQEAVFNGGTGFAYNKFGIVIEYVPKNEIWGASLKFDFFNTQNYNSQTEKDPNKGDLYFKNKSDFNYFTTSALIRLTIDNSGFYLMAGMNYDFVKYTNTERIQVTNNTGEISDVENYKYGSVNSKLGFQAGVGTEIFIADMFGIMRARISPSITLAYTSNFVGKQNTKNISTPSLSALSLNLGMSVKLGFDEIELDTLKFDPNFKQDINSMVTAKTDRGVAFQGFTKNELNEVSQLKFLGESSVKARVSEEPELTRETKKRRPRVARDSSQTSIALKDTSSTQTSVPVEEEVKVNIPIGKEKVMLYAQSSTIDMNKEMKTYFTNVARAWKENPKLDIRIETHSDNAGTKEENEQRAAKRAEAIKTFLMSKGVDSKKIFITAFGDRKPIGDTRTSEGKRLNRRVKVTVALK